jgi:hypothetical protein
LSYAGESKSLISSENTEPSEQSRRELDAVGGSHGSQA